VVRQVRRYSPRRGVRDRGIFLVVAAIEAKPQQAKGVDSALRVLASTPLGPWLLVLAAIGLIMFGLFSLGQAKWERL
jgi:type IV secretory pathway VirB2 component (pilin)